MALLGSGLAIPAMPVRAASNQSGYAFDYGVAAGDPGPHGAVLWTRLTTPPDHPGSTPALVTVVLTIREDRDGAPVLVTRYLDATPEREFTVKIDLVDLRLDHGRTYRYQFAAQGVQSPVGRFRTLPQSRLDKLTLAVACCALYPGGFFHAYRAIAELAELDAVVFLGDYIYEYGPADYGAATGRQTGRIPAPDHECVSLADYRARFAQARSDPDLQAAHARAAWICSWDDHELANDAAMGGAQNHQPATEGEWASRKAAAIRAFYEWMPIREPAPGADPFQAWRSFAFGDLARLIMLETRLTGRDRQLSFNRGEATPETIQTFQAALADPTRRMIGADQEAWLSRELAESARKEAWQLLGSGVLMAKVRQIDAKAALGEEAFAKLPAGDRRAQALVDLPDRLDAWDGYPLARERIYGAIKASRAQALVLSGDTHNFWMNHLHDASGAPVAAELGAGPISSPIGASPRAPAGLDAEALLVSQNSDLVAHDAKSHGFGLVTLSRQSMECRWIGVSDITQPARASSTLARFSVGRGEGRIGEVKRL